MNKSSVRRDFPVTEREHDGACKEAAVFAVKLGGNTEEFVPYGFLRVFYLPKIGNITIRRQDNGNHKDPVQDLSFGRGDAQGVV